MDKPDFRDGDGDITPPNLQRMPREVDQDFHAVLPCLPMRQSSDEWSVWGISRGAIRGSIRGKSGKGCVLQFFGCRSLPKIPQGLWRSRKRSAAGRAGLSI